MPADRVVVEVEEVTDPPGHSRGAARLVLVLAAAALVAGSLLDLYTSDLARSSLQAGLADSVVDAA